MKRKIIALLIVIACIVAVVVAFNYLPAGVRIAAVISVGIGLIGGWFLRKYFETLLGQKE